MLLLVVECFLRVKIVEQLDYIGGFVLDNPTKGGSVSKYLKSDQGSK